MKAKILNPENLKAEKKPEKKPYIAPYVQYKVRAKYRSEDSDWTAWAQTTEDPKVSSLYYLEDDGEFRGRPTNPRERAIWHARNAESPRHGYDAQVIQIDPGNKQTLIYVTGVGECNIQLKEGYELFAPTGDNDED